VGAQRIADDGLHIVASIEADQAGLDTYAMLAEFGESRLDRLGYRLWFPRPGYPILVKPDDEDAGGGSVQVLDGTRRTPNWRRLPRRP